jgi:hypothetical protein
MQKVISCFIVVIFLFVNSSCKKSLKSGEYVNYVVNNERGLKKVTEVDGFEFSMQYRPYDYIILMESKGDFSNYDFNKRLSCLKGTAWFSISIKRVDNGITPLRYGISSIEEYNLRLNYFLNEAKKDLWLMYDSIKIYPTSYLFENNYSLTPQETMIIGFFLPSGENSPQKTMQLAYNDRIFKNGIIKATYPDKLLKNIPNLIYKN